MNEKALMSMQPIPDNLQIKKQHVQKVKVVTLGDMCVGKTSLTMKFVKDKFDETYTNTVGASFMAKAVEIPDKTVIFQVWDTAGQERFHSLIPMYLRDARAAIVVYDVTDLESFKNIKVNWLQSLHKYGPDNLRVAIVGNKVDLTDEMSVPTREARKFAQDHNFLFMETSAKTGHNVEKLFYDVAHLLGDCFDEDKESSGTDSNVHLSEEDMEVPALKTKRKCCS